MVEPELNVRNELNLLERQLDKKRPVERQVGGRMRDRWTHVER